MKAKEKNNYVQSNLQSSRQEIPGIRGGSSSTVRAILENDDRHFYNTISTPTPQAEEIVIRAGEEAIESYGSDSDLTDEIYHRRPNSNRYRTAPQYTVNIDNDYNSVVTRLPQMQNFRAKQATDVRSKGSNSGLNRNGLNEHVNKTPRITSTSTTTTPTLPSLSPSPPLSRTTTTAATTTSTRIPPTRVFLTTTPVSVSRQQQHPNPTSSSRY